MSFFKIFLLSIMIYSNQLFAEEVIIGAEDNAAPWSYADGTGYVNDVVAAAFASVEWKVKYEVYPYARCKSLTILGKIIGCFSTSKSQDLKNVLLFPKYAVIEPRNILFAKKNSKLEGCDSNKWKPHATIGYVNGYEYKNEFEKLRKNKNIVFEVTPSEILNLRKLERSHVDGAIITIDEVHSLEFMSMLAEVTPDFKIVCDYGSEPAYLSFSKVHPQGQKALAAFKKGMEHIIKNGSLKTIQKMWKLRALEKKIMKNK